MPPSLCTCAALVGVQAHENQLASLPAGPWPATLETLFVQSNAPLTALPPSLAAGARLKRVNLSKLQLDAASTALCEQIKATVLAAEEGIFWGCDGQREAEQSLYPRGYQTAHPLGLPQHRCRPVGFQDV